MSWTRSQSIAAAELVGKDSLTIPTVLRGDPLRQVRPDTMRKRVRIQTV